MKLLTWMRKNWFWAAVILIFIVLLIIITLGMILIPVGFIIFKNKIPKPPPMEGLVLTKKFEMAKVKKKKKVKKEKLPKMIKKKIKFSEAEKTLPEVAW